MYRYKLNFIIYTTISFERFTSPLNPKWFASLCFVTKTFSQMFIKNANHSVERTVRIRKVVGSIPIRSTTKSREIINFTAFFQLFCKNGGPVAQPFPPCFPYQPPAPFASAGQETKNDHCFLFSAPRERPKRSGNEWFTSKHIVQDGSHSLCAVLPVSTPKASQRHISCFRKSLFRPGTTPQYDHK